MKALPSLPKLVVVLLLLAIFQQPVHAQLLKDLKNRAEQKLKQKAEQKIDQKMDKTIDDATSGKKKTDTPATENNNESSKADQNNKKPANDGTVFTNTKDAGAPTFKTYSKYDFVPGDKILVVEDFSQDAVGDFPGKWNTNSSAEVVTVDGQAGHWLMMKKQGRFVPDFIKNLPENFTLQFDLLCNEKFSFYSVPLSVLMLSGDNAKGVFDYSFIAMGKRSGIKASFHPANAGSTGGTVTLETFDDGAPVINNSVTTPQFNAHAGKNFIKVSIWRQKQRMRIYCNEEKVFDLPRAFAADKIYNTVMLELWSGMNNDEDRYLINNIKLAVGAPDTRNKLITEGKFVTRGILFDVNSDVIKPESYGVLKDIANVLTENATVKVKIIGHTDSDGDDNSNLSLSKRRAEAVKKALSTEWGIDASRLEPDGKGEKEPVDNNTTIQGKANNRRVEFIKL